VGMRRLAIISTAIALLAIGFVAGTLYWQRRVPRSPAPIIAPVITKIAPGESVITFPEPVEGTPEPNPRLIVKASIRDTMTGQPVDVHFTFGAKDEIIVATHTLQVSNEKLSRTKKS